MNFISFEFIVFFFLFYILYWSLRSSKLTYQNLLILISSYIFYGWWDWRFLSLILLSTIVDYFTGNQIKAASTRIRKRTWLAVSITVNLGILGFFKYCNFFIESFGEVLSIIGLKSNLPSLQIILPVGISFYTFQTLSYSIDIYREKLSPTKDFIAFASFVSFFPQLVAGPIERAINFISQFLSKRSFDLNRSVDGLRQILLGLFKKVVVADSCAFYVNDIFINQGDYSGSTLLIGGILFAFQIYGDFSGYSDIAIGSARLLGFDLMKNFALPYFSRDIAEFWRRWHISLSSWFRDYLYIPLGGSKASTGRVLFNVFAVFVVSGLWHGANWTFVVWGFLNACYFLPLILLNKNRNNMNIVAENKILPSIKEFFQIIITFSLTVIAWVFFRAENVTEAFIYVKKIFSTSLLSFPELVPLKVFTFITILLLFEWIQRRKHHTFEFGSSRKFRIVRWLFYLILIYLIVQNSGSTSDFIYFQF